MKELDEWAGKLIQTHPEQQQTIIDHQSRINEQWNDLTTKADNRKSKLVDSYDFQRFLGDYRFVFSLLTTVLFHTMNEQTVI